MTTEHAPQEASVLDALVPLVCLVVVIAGSLALFGLDALDGPTQVGLLLCCAVVALIALKNGHTWADVQEAGQGAMTSITTAIFILLAVGALIGTWNLSGTIPTLVYYGLQVLNPTWYYLCAAVICGVVAMAIGSSWTTAGTVGVGLVGIAVLLGASPEVTAGAVISGAYLGDKLSPLSETTVLTAQLVGVDVPTHIRAQAWTSVPAFLVGCVVFTVIGLSGSADSADLVPTSIELHSLGDIYWITALNLLPLLLLVVLSVRKVPASLALLASAIFAGLLGAFLQPDVYADFLGTDGVGPLGAIKATWSAMANGFTISSGIGEIDRLLSRGGMDSMLPTLWLIIGAVTFGVLMEKFGMIARLLDPLIARATTTGRLFLTVFATGFGLNVVAGDQYIALVLPARTYPPAFRERGLALTNLSRLAADSGTVTSPLVPWNSCGAFMASVLGVATIHYLPFAIFCFMSPLLSVIYGFTGFKVVRTAASSPVVDD